MGAPVILSRTGRRGYSPGAALRGDGFFCSPEEVHPLAWHPRRVFFCPRIGFIEPDAR